MQQSSIIKWWFIGVLVVNYLVRTPGLLDEYHIGRFVWLSLLCLVSCLLILPNFGKFRINVVDLTYVLFYLLAVVSLCWAIVPAAGYVSAQTLLLGLVCYLTFRCSFDYISDKIISKLIALVSLIVLFITSWQLLDIGLQGGLGGQEIYKVIGYSGHKNPLASFIFLLFGITLVYTVRNPGNHWNYLLVFWQCTVMILLRSRTVYLTLIVLFLLIALYLLFSNQSSRKILIRRLLPLVAGALLISGIIFWKLGGTIQDIERLNPKTYMKDASSIERLFVWYRTKNLIEDEWVFGYGSGNWKIIFPSKSISGGHRLQSEGVIFTRAHNDFLEIWTENGIFGFLLFIALFGWALWSLFYSMRGSSRSKGIELVLLVGSLLGYAIISFLEFPKERMETQVLFSFILARSIYLSSDFLERKGLSWKLPNVYYLILVGCFCLGLLFNLVLGYRQIIGEAHTLKAIRAQLNNQWELVEKESKLAYSPLYKISPLGTPIKWLEGLSLYHQGNFEGARRTFEDALQHSPYFFRLLNDYAGCLVQLQDFRRAESIYRQVLFINPKFEEGMFNIAYVYAQLNAFDEAFEWVNKTTLDPNKKEEFIREIKALKTRYEQRAGNK